MKHFIDQYESLDLPLPFPSEIWNQLRERSYELTVMEAETRYVKGILMGLGTTQDMFKFILYLFDNICLEVITGESKVSIETDSDEVEENCSVSRLNFK